MTNHERQRAGELRPERRALARQLKEHLNRRAEKVKDVPDGELDAAVEEAIGRVRQQQLEKGDRDAKECPSQGQ